MITAPVHGAPVRQGNYVPAQRNGNLIVTAGMTPRIDGRLVYFGPVRNDADVEGYREAVSLACSNALTAAQSLLQTGEELDAILAMTVYIAAEPDFIGHSRLADLASAFLLQKLGQVGVCSRGSGCRVSAGRRSCRNPAHGGSQMSNGAFFAPVT